MGVDIARVARAAGHRVVATVRDFDRAATAVAGGADAARGAGSGGGQEELLVHTLDITNDAAAAVGVQAAVDRFGRIDVLVNNAGSFQPGFFEEVNPAQFRTQVETNFYGPLNHGGLACRSEYVA